MVLHKRKRAALQFSRHLSHVRAQATPCTAWWRKVLFTSDLPVNTAEHELYCHIGYCHPTDGSEAQGLGGRMATAGPNASTNSNGAASTITVVFIGHHQSGKSSAAGHLLVRTRGVDKRTLDRVERDTSSRPLCRYSWVSVSTKWSNTRAYA